MSGKTERGEDRETGLAIVTRYDHAMAYIYKLSKNIPRYHGSFRDELLSTLFSVPREIYAAAKSGQVSRVNNADGLLAHLRWMLRFAAQNEQRIITCHQQATAEARLAHVGKMLGEWQRKKRHR